MLAAAVARSEGGPSGSVRGKGARGAQTPDDRPSDWLRTLVEVRPVVMLFGESAMLPIESECRRRT
jgi:hypothetical protein